MELFAVDVVRREIVRGHVVDAEVAQDDVGCGFGFKFALVACLLFGVFAVFAVMQVFVCLCDRLHNLTTSATDLPACVMESNAVAS